MHFEEACTRPEVTNSVIKIPPRRIEVRILNNHFFFKFRQVKIKLKGTTTVKIKRIANDRRT